MLHFYTRANPTQLSAHLIVSPCLFFPDLSIALDPPKALEVIDREPTGQWLLVREIKTDRSNNKKKQTEVNTTKAVGKLEGASVTSSLDDAAEATEATEAAPDASSTSIDATANCGWVPVSHVKVVNIPKLLQKRQKVIRELVATEETFVHSLNVLVDLWLEPLELAGSRILPSEDLECIMRNVVQLRDIHAKFLERLKSRLRRWNVRPTIGDLFVTLIEQVRQAYPSYVNNHEDALDLVKALEHSPKHEKFQNHARQCREHPMAKGLGLSALLITPIQRIPRYRLLLQEVLKQTCTGHPDTAYLRRALEEMKGVATYINEELR